MLTIPLPSIKMIGMKRVFIFCFLTCAIRYSSSAQVADSVEIKQLLEKESATWRSGDLKAHADCWHIQPYSKILISTADGRFIDLPPSSMINPPAGFAGRGGYSVNSNYNISIHGNDAWVSHDEVSTALDSTKNFTTEVRLLEKINGQWKLVGESMHAYNRKP